MPNLVICLKLIRFALFGPRDRPTTNRGVNDIICPDIGPNYLFRQSGYSQLLYSCSRANGYCLWSFTTFTSPYSCISFYIFKRWIELIVYVCTTSTSICCYRTFLIQATGTRKYIISYQAEVTSREACAHSIYGHEPRNWSPEPDKILIDLLLFLIWLYLVCTVHCHGLDHSSALDFRLFVCI